MNEIIELLKLSPGLGITLGFIFAAFIAWLFKDLIVLYVKKKYDLFDLNEIRYSVSKIITDINLLETFDKSSIMENKILSIPSKIAKSLRDERKNHGNNN